MNITQGMVLAAGRGMRMRPLTDTMPKPMIEVAGRSMLDRAIDHLAQAGVSRLVVNGSYMAEMLKAHLEKRASPPWLFSYEEEPLETGGGIARALPLFDSAPFYCVNGDIIWLDGTIPALTRLSQHWQEGLDALLLLHKVERAIGYEGRGDFFVDGAGQLTRRSAQENAPYVYCGVQLLHPRLFEGCPPGAFSLNVLYDRAIRATGPRIKGLVHDGAWLHVGDVAGKALAETYLAQQSGNR